MHHVTDSGRPVTAEASGPSGPPRHAVAGPGRAAPGDAFGAPWQPPPVASFLTLPTIPAARVRSATGPTPAPGAPARRTVRHVGPVGLSAAAVGAPDVLLVRRGGRNDRVRQGVTSGAWRG
ncbi:hypothetical protein GCM10010254_30490 [Streptomyces chromofuscus]|nr:hypothetical protein GCM10010254_30490 [Streptomyces chromofuscus]